VIVAANHTCGIDPIMIIGTSPHRLVSYMVAREFYRKPLAKYFCDMVNCIPINRDSPGKEFLAACLRVLKHGGVLGVFPQGRFAVPGEPEPELKNGVGVIALRTGAPVIPVHISGAKYHDSPFAGYFLRHNVRIRYGKPVDLSRFAGRERDREAAQEASELVMQRIRELGQANP
jgi:1-acyl-sn-glycerol-3-phosphate acyltransferase